MNGFEAACPRRVIKSLNFVFDVAFFPSACVPVLKSRRVNRWRTRLSSSLPPSTFDSQNPKSAIAPNRDPERMYASLNIFLNLNGRDLLDRKKPGDVQRYSRAEKF